MMNYHSQAVRWAGLHLIICFVAAATSVSSFRVAYSPGNLTVEENGLMLSAGLQSRIIAVSGEPVRYDTGGKSAWRFHDRPDGAGVFADTDTGGWIYASNSESWQGGGVGAIIFDADGRVTKYRRVQRNMTKLNCGGGKTPWNTWLTCEEHSEGQIWEVDPWERYPPRKTIVGGGDGAMYESAAYDFRDVENPFFYFTVDERDGPVVRFIPDKREVKLALSNNDFSRLLHSNSSGTARREYLVITYLSETSGEGFFTWSDNVEEGRRSAKRYFRFCEGIDHSNGRLYITAKAEQRLFILDLDKFKLKMSSTKCGAFDKQPDQVARLTGDRADRILYFCEDARKGSGVHGRDKDGRYYTVLQGSSLKGETSGLGFSPNGMFMYVAFQFEGILLEIRRADGLPFQGKKLDIKYHAMDAAAV